MQRTWSFDEGDKVRDIDVDSDA